MVQIQRIRDLQAKLNEYERIIKLKIESDLNILIQLAQIDIMMDLQSNGEDLRIDDIVITSEEVSEVTCIECMDVVDSSQLTDSQAETEERIELPYQVKSKRGRPKKRRN